MNKTTYTVNQDCFSSQTPESCYWAGFLMADGCIVKPKSSNAQSKLSLAIQSKDKDHLERFKSFCNFNGPIYYRDQGLSKEGNLLRRVDINITSEKMCKDLETVFNITPRKTFTATFPDIPDLINRRCFVIGLIDGDGCISKQVDINRLTINVMGTHNICENVKLCFDEITKAYGCNVVHKETMFRYRVGGRVAATLYNGLYCIIMAHKLPVLKRKWVITEEYLQLQHSKKSY